MSHQASERSEQREQSSRQPPSRIGIPWRVIFELGCYVVLPTHSNSGEETLSVGFFGPLRHLDELPRLHNLLKVRIDFKISTVLQMISGFLFDLEPNRPFSFCFLFVLFTMKRYQGIYCLSTQRAKKRHF